MYYCFSVPYYLAFGWNHDRGVIPWDMFFDSILFVDIIVKFFTLFCGKGLKCIKLNRDLVVKVLLSGVLIDIFCVIPFYAAYDQLMWFRILRLFQINQLRTALENVVRRI